MSKRRVLIFIDWFLPGDKAGGPVRSCVNLIAHLGNEFEFSVITRNTDYMSVTPYAKVKSDAWNTLEDGTRVYYISSAQLQPETIMRLLQEENPEVIYLNGIWSQPFTAWPLRARKKLRSHAKVVVAARGMLAPAAMAIKKTKKRAFLMYAKFTGLFREVVFHATTETEMEQVRQFFGEDAQVLVAGNLPRKANAGQTPRTAKASPLRIVSVARIAPEKNTAGALEVLQRVKAQVTADFYGTVYDAAYNERCLALAKTLPENVNVRFPGAVDSSEIPALLQRYDLLLLPTLGENFGHIILEAMQAGLPVLISDKTPWRNLAEQKAGWDLPLDDLAKFAKQIDEVAAMAPAAYSIWSEGALKFAGKYTGDQQLLMQSRNLFS